LRERERERRKRVDGERDKGNLKLTSMSFLVLDNVVNFVFLNSINSVISFLQI